jgi:hypothetical protein
MTAIADLTAQITILARTGTINPDTGGTISGPSTPIAVVRAAIAPRGGLEALSTAQPLIGADLGIVNTATHVITTWFRPDVTVGQWIEYQDPTRGGLSRSFEITQLASPAERGQWLVLGCVERVAP